MEDFRTEIACGCWSEATGARQADDPSFVVHGAKQHAVHRPGKSRRGHIQRLLPNQNPHDSSLLHDPPEEEAGPYEMGGPDFADRWRCPGRIIRLIDEACRKPGRKRTRAISVAWIHVCHGGSMHLGVCRSLLRDALEGQ